MRLNQKTNEILAPKYEKKTLRSKLWTSKREQLMKNQRKMTKVRRSAIEKNLLRKSLIKQSKLVITRDK